jgi:uncharacterized protein (TIGR02246 family)
MNTAGIVNYKISKDGSLAGRWTHQDIQGKTATERAWGGTPGKLAGRYDVEIRFPDGQKIFEGSLAITPFGEAYALAWTGRQLLPEPRDARFTGIGTLENSDTLVATFQEEVMPTWRVTAREVFDKIPGPQGERYVEAFTHGTLRVLLYAPRKSDPQQPHEQDEVYVVMKGSGSFMLENRRRPFAEGDVLFVSAKRPHRFEDFSDDLVVWVVFYGPRGGESQDDSQKAIEQANADFRRAYAKADAKVVAAMYTETAKLMPPHARTVSGRPAIEKFWKSVMSAGIKDVELKTLEIESFGDTIAEEGTATLYGDGSLILDRGKYLVVWKRDDGKWKLHRDCWNSNEPQPKE